MLNAFAAHARQFYKNHTKQVHTTAIAAAVVVTTYYIGKSQGRIINVDVVLRPREVLVPVNTFEHIKKGS